MSEMRRWGFVGGLEDLEKESCSRGGQKREQLAENVGWRCGLVDGWIRMGGR